MTSFFHIQNTILHEWVWISIQFYAYIEFLYNHFLSYSKYYLVWNQEYECQYGYISYMYIEFQFYLDAEPCLYSVFLVQNTTQNFDNCKTCFFCIVLPILTIQKFVEEFYIVFITMSQKFKTIGIWNKII